MTTVINQPIPEYNLIFDPATPPGGEIPTDILTESDIGVSIASFNHNHDSTYSAIGHNHSGIYEPADATILKSSDIGITVASFNHNHDSTYSAIGHNHSGIYEPIDNTILRSGSIGTTIPSPTGTGASGSWNISVTGSSASCTGNAATVTNGVYTTGDQTIGGIKTFSSNVISTSFVSSADNLNRFTANRMILRGVDPTIIFRDTDHNSAMIHCNSNLLYFLRGVNDTETWTQVNGQWPL